tara:strand:+ start:196 stop:381 length:186 start_codon:yes stop_codon:yes gene_type:complete
VQETYTKINDKEWLIRVQEDGKTKDLYIQFPPDAIDQVGWVEGDLIDWLDNGDGSWTLKKK